MPSHHLCERLDSHLSNEKHPGCLGYIGDDILPSYIGIIINQYKDPYESTRIQRKVIRVFFVAHLDILQGGLTLVDTNMNLPSGG